MVDARWNKDKYIEMRVFSIIGLMAMFAFGCNFKASEPSLERDILKPILKTDTVPHDTDDPAIWINVENPEESLILGTDKEVNGGLFVFDVSGKMIDSLSVQGLQYPNNVDVEYGFEILEDSLVDLAVTVERQIGKVRIFSLPEMRPLDGGGIDVFLDESSDTLRRPMGVALFKDKHGDISVILSRKRGPTNGEYLWQYTIIPDDNGNVDLKLVRKFGKFSGGESEIEAVMVDDELGFVYYSDEAKGIRKYYADPANGSEELALFGTLDFKEDREGIALWKIKGSAAGYIVVSNQQENTFNIYNRDGGASHEHKIIGKWYLSTVESDGCDLTTVGVSDRFPQGFFIAMSEDKTFHLYDIQDLEDIIESY